MGAAIEDVDYYALLEVPQTATLKEITTAYRKKSLRVHPDRNPDNPEAAALFHDLKTGYDVLQDPTKRASFDALLNARNARKIRFEGLDNKRKAMAEDLDRRERDWKRQKGEEDAAEREKTQRIERLKEEGRKLREQRELAELSKLAAQKEAQKPSPAAAASTPVAQQQRRPSYMADTLELDPLDTTLRIKLTKLSHPSVSTSETLETLLSSLVASPSLPPLSQSIDSAVISKQKEKSKHLTALVSFRTLSAAARVKKSYDLKRGNREWEGVQVEWAKGEAPLLIQEKDREEAEQNSTPAVPSSFSNGSRGSRGSRDDLPKPPKQESKEKAEEDDVLRRMRAREEERRRIMEEMEKEDAA